MAIRIENPTLDDTTKLLEQVLLVIIRDDSRALFLCPAGCGPVIMQRLRVMLSRQRKKVQARGKRTKHFRLRNTIHTETHNGIRHDACVVWREVSDVAWLKEELESMLVMDGGM